MPLNNVCPVAVNKRVRVTGIMPEDPDPIPVGSTGTVFGGNSEQIWVRWDDINRSICLLVTDPYEVIS